MAATVTDRDYTRCNLLPVVLLILLQACTGNYERYSGKIMIKCALLHMRRSIYFYYSRKNIDKMRRIYFETLLKKMYAKGKCLIYKYDF